MSGDALLGATVQVALQAVLSFATDQIGMIKGFNQDLERLRRIVVMISASVEDAEKKRQLIEDSTVTCWLKNLESVACRAEHVLDEINYEMHRRTVEGKVSSILSVSSHNPIAFRLRMVHKLKNIISDFKDISEEATALGLQAQRAASAAANTTVSPSNTGFSRETDSILGHKVIGRENDASWIVNKLVSPSNDQPLNLIPIKGMGGLGKTTLARLVYNDEKIINHFQQRIWVGVPEDCEPKSIFKLILESFSKEGMESLNLTGRDAIIQKIKDKLKDKRYLLVLDDVWEVNDGLWDDFFNSLRGISTTHGNWIIVTTRKLQMASVPYAENDFPLERLSDENCLEIVKDKAFIRDESFQEFEAIRGNIMKLCQGLPLAARVIGGLILRTPKQGWISVVEKGISEMTGNEDFNVMQILKLSFDRLPKPYMKRCFAYCSLFEKDSTMEKKELIQLWMAEGFLQSKSGQDDVEIGNECINSLLGNSLLEEVNYVRGECKSVQMHDLLHDLAESISNPRKDLKDVRKDDSYIVMDSSGEVKALQKMKMVQTSFSRIGLPSSIPMMTFKHLHVLRLTEVDKLPSSIDKLMHLRYLGVFYSRIKVFPESVSKLYNLQTLRIQSCGYRGVLPKGMTKLINLRHLHYHGFDQSLPAKIGKLTNLQTLEEFRTSEENQIKELGGLKYLRGKLTIDNLDGVSSKEEAQKAELNRKPLNSLSFRWRRRDGENSEMVLEGLQPHKDLQELRISGFPGNQFPSWFMNMDYKFVVSLQIENCNRCEQLPALGKLPSLEYLKLSGLQNLSCIEASFYGIDDRNGQKPIKVFPALRHMKMEDMMNLEEWMEYHTLISDVELFPKIEELAIEDCPRLSNVPIHYFENLQRLYIGRTNLRRIYPMVARDQSCSSRASDSAHVQKDCFTPLEILIIYLCPNLSELPLRKFQSLQNIWIWHCPNLKSLSVPIGVGQQLLTSLQRLSIRDCDELINLPNDLLKSCVSLKCLAIVDCNKLSSLPVDLLESCASLESLGISGLSNLESLSLGLQHTPSLRFLSLGRFSDSVHFDWPNLVSLPNQLQCLTALTELHLEKFKQIEALPDWFGKLVSLEKLRLCHCEKLCYFPSKAAMKILTKLSWLWIDECPLLKERCTESSDPNSERAKISHIPNIIIDGEALS